MPVHWLRNASSVQAWNTSWNPNRPGNGFGRLVAYAIALNVKEPVQEPVVAEAGAG